MPQNRIRDFDFKPRAARTGGRSRLRNLHWLALGLSGAAGVALLFSGAHRADATSGDTDPAPSSAVALALPIPDQANPPALDALPPATPPAPAVAAKADVPVPPQAHSESGEAEANTAPVEVVAEPAWRKFTVKSGDSLAAIFKRAGLDHQVVYEVVNAGEAAKTLRRIFPGDEMQLGFDDAGQLVALRYPVDESVTLHIVRQPEGYKSSLVANPLERRLTHAAATIDSSLFAAGKEAGLSDSLIMELAGIFGWDVDFALDIRAGDRFTVVYEDLYRDGARLRQGNIVAAEFVNQGRTYRAVLYTDPDGNRNFYSPDGKSMRKAFLRSPVDFRRISSRFQPERYHPILGKKRPHRGVDYAAATGTPIKAAGDGKVIFRGRKGGYGNTVILQHGHNITTLYGHMSKFRHGVTSGSRVKQGQIIGYVGMTGLATGPHLHYEFRINGVHRNPLTVKLPDAQPIPSKYRAEFMQQSHQLLAQLDRYKSIQVAAAGDQ